MIRNLTINSYQSKSIVTWEENANGVWQWRFATIDEPSSDQAYATKEEALEAAKQMIDVYALRWKVEQFLEGLEKKGHISFAEYQQVSAWVGAIARSIIIDSRS